jgi:glutathione S-transferase
LYFVVQKIYSSLPNANAFKALIAAEYVGEKIEQVNVQLGTENKTPEFLKLNPAGKVGGRCPFSVVRLQL